MPRPQIPVAFSDSDSAVTENYECTEESEIPVACEVEESCGDLEDKTR